MTNLPVENSAPAPKQSYFPLIWMIVSQVLGLLSLIPWLFIAATSIMAFDSGPSTGAYAFVGAVWSYPLLPVGCSILAWVLYAGKKRRAALVVTSLPFLLLFLFGCIFGLFMMPGLIAQGSMSITPM